MNKWLSKALNKGCMCNYTQWHTSKLMIIEDQTSHSMEFNPFALLSHPENLLGVQNLQALCPCPENFIGFKKKLLTVTVLTHSKGCKVFSVSLSLSQFIQMFAQNKWQNQGPKSIVRKQPISFLAQTMHAHPPSAVRGLTLSSPQAPLGRLVARTLQAPLGDL